MVDRLTDAGVDLVEQPATGLAFLAEVTASARVPIIADESCWDVADALEVVRYRAADCISIYLAKAGGFVGAVQWLPLPRHNGWPVTSMDPLNPPLVMPRIRISRWPMRRCRWRR